MHKHAFGWLIGSIDQGNSSIGKLKKISPIRRTVCGYGAMNQKIGLKVNFRVAP